MAEPGGAQAHAGPQSHRELDEVRLHILSLLSRTGLGPGVWGKPLFKDGPRGFQWETSVPAQNVERNMAASGKVREAHSP